MIIQNVIKVEDTYLVSKYKHDYQEYKGYVVDGGLDYIKGIFPNQKPTLKQRILSYFRKVTVDNYPYILTEANTMQEICDRLICEFTLRPWKELTDFGIIQAYRKQILNQWMHKEKLTLTDHTMRHALLHMYVSGYWLVQHKQAKLTDGNNNVQKTKAKRKTTKTK